MLGILHWPAGRIAVGTLCNNGGYQGINAIYHVVGWRVGLFFSVLFLMTMYFSVSECLVSGRTSQGDNLKQRPRWPGSWPRSWPTEYGPVNNTQWKHMCLPTLMRVPRYFECLCR